MIPTVLELFYDLVSLKNDVNVPSKSNQQKKLRKKIIFVGVLKVHGEYSRVRIH
jgi:hypothetical protein